MNGQLEEQPFGIGRYMDAQVRLLRDRIPAALKRGETDAVHQSRVATRRLKAAIDLLEPVLRQAHAATFARTLSKLRRRLGKLRDLDVIRKNLESSETTDVTPDAAVWLLRRCQLARDEAWGASMERPGASRVLANLGQWWGLQEDVEEVRPEVDDLLARSVRDQLESFGKKANRMGEGDNGADAHELRLAGKVLRYTLEMAVEQGHALLPEILVMFKQMQDALGRWHDHVVLTEFALKQSAETMLAHHQAELQAQVLDLARSAVTKASKDLETFNLLWRENGGVIVDAVGGLFPPGETVIPVLPSAEAPKEVAGEVPAEESLKQPEMDPDQPDSTVPPESSHPEAAGPVV